MFLSMFDLCVHLQSQIGLLQQKVKSLKQENDQLTEANKELKKKQQEWESECNRSVCVYHKLIITVS